MFYVTLFDALHQPSLMYKYGGKNWIVIESFALSLLDIHFSTPDDGWAVGLGGAVHYEGGNWAIELGTEESKIPDYDYPRLYSVYMLSPSNGWTVGEYGRIYHCH
jgi:photosystem II stability/assembly factor-like uncharacterized protein